MKTRRHEPAVTPALAREHGLSDSEYQKLVQLLGRTPSFTELGIVSVMWSEHCSYKSSKKLLRTLPTEGPRVVQGPGENAGAVSIGDGEAIVFKIESHNHPSAVEPYQGATTGVGGILRDIFTMGARPIAMLDSLRFGDPKNPKVKRLAEGVVRGIADYGNCVGVPTVAGEVYFHPCYEGNPLVNAMCVGRIKEEKLTRAIARSVGGLVIYFGNATGRDGVHGATFASEELTEETMAQRSAVQVGDPFMGKKILEATLDLIEAGVIEAIQDMGAAGLTCSSCEMGSRGGLGVRIDLDKVPQRATGLSPYELMLSESQERMLAVCAPEDLARVRAVLGKWDLEAYEIGEVTGDGNLSVWHEGEEVARLPNRLLADEAPVYDLPAKRPEYLDRIRKVEDCTAEGGCATLRQDDVKRTREREAGGSIEAAARRLLGSPTIASKRWITEQFDTQVQTQTVIGPGGGAAVLRLKGAEKHIALKTDCNSLFCYLDPREGAKMAVAECARNLVCAGAKPLAVTNCLNFGNPNKPEVYWQLAECIAGLSEACRALGTPVTGGNVSLYNENPGGAVFPTPVIGMVGLIEAPQRPMRPFFEKPGMDLWLLGPEGKTLGGSQFAQMYSGDQEPVGPCPRIDLEMETKLQNFVLELNAGGMIETAQDLSEGGLFIAAAEGAIGGSAGAKLEHAPEGIDPLLWFFGEDPTRILVSATPEMGETVAAEARARGIGARRVGRTGGEEIAVEGEFEMKVGEAREIYFREP